MNNISKKIIVGALRNRVYELEQRIEPIITPIGIKVLDDALRIERKEIISAIKEVEDTY